MPMPAETEDRQGQIEIAVEVVDVGFQHVAIAGDPEAGGMARDVPEHDFRLGDLDFVVEGIDCGVEALVADIERDTASRLAIGSLPDPSEVDSSGGVLNSPIGSTIQYQPVCGCENRRSPSCGLPASTDLSLTTIELMTL